MKTLIAAFAALLITASLATAGILTDKEDCLAAGRSEGYCDAALSTESLLSDVIPCEDLDNDDVCDI